MFKNKRTNVLYTLMYTLSMYVWIVTNTLMHLCTYIRTFTVEYSKEIILGISLK